MTGIELIEGVTKQVIANGSADEEVSYTDVLDYLASIGFGEAVDSYVSLISGGKK